MTAVAELLQELDRHHVVVIRHGDRVRLKGPTTIPADLVAWARRLKPELIRHVPDSNARPVLAFRLPGFAKNAWAVALGRPGETVETLRADLHARWPDVEAHP